MSVYLLRYVIFLTICFNTVTHAFAVKDIQKAVDLHGATPHVFRHSYLSMLNQAGVDPKTIQRIGGHGSFIAIV